MADEFIYSMYRMTKAYPSRGEVLKDISLSFFPGAKIGVLGLNGSGKSTLLRIMAGVDTEFRGEAWIAKDAAVRLLSQEPELDPSKDVRGNVLDGLATQRDLLARFEDVSAAMADPDADLDALLAEQADLQQRIDALDAWNLDHRIDLAMNALRVPPGDRDVQSLSGGERRRVALARLLLSQPDLLLLDEPTNHLDAESVAWLEQHLARYPGTVVAITHDRYFLDNVAEWILELDRGRGIPWKGNYSSWLDQKAERMRVEEKQDKARERTLQRELEWIRMAPRARHAKSKARITNFEQLAAQGSSGDGGSSVIRVPVSRRLGDVVIEARNLTKAYGDRLLFDDLSFSLPRGGIVGVVGANGTGKTTLLRMLVDQEAPDAGELVIGDSVDIGYVDQTRDALDAGKTVWEEISGGHDMIVVGGREVPSRAYVGAFNFRGSDQQQRVGDLSGGQRNRVHLAKLLCHGCNLLLLDEPTNDLDVDTLRSLEEGLLEFGGCAVVVSHDRWFLDRIATHILAFEGDSEVIWFEGNYQQYEQHRRERLGEDAMTPKRITYRPLAHS